MHALDERRFPVTGDVQLHVMTWAAAGPATPVLLVHGLSSNARLWVGVGERLATAGHPVAAVDQRGHGLSDKPRDGYDYATLTSDLVAVMDALGWQRPYVSGQSWGANVALELAARAPARSCGLALVDGGTGDLAARFADWETCRAALSPPQIEGMTAADFEKAVRSSHPGWPEAGINGTLANVEVLPDGTIRPWLSRPNHLAILRQMWDHGPSGLYASVDVPVLLLPARDPSNQRWMAGKREGVAYAETRLARATTHWIDGDHDLHAQHPDTVAALIHRAAEGVPSSEAPP